LTEWETDFGRGGGIMDTVHQHRSKRLWMLVFTLLMAVQPAAWADGNMRRVGMVTLFNIDPASPPPPIKRMMDTIRAFVPAQNVTFTMRGADGKSDRYPEIVTDLVREHVDVIFALPGPSAVAAQQVTTTVPVVFQIAANPVTLGLVKSLEKPGGNITGLYEELPDFQSKRMALLKEMVPQAKTIGILWDADAWGERVGSEMAQRTEKAVLAAGVRAEIVAVRGPDNLERAFSLLKQARVDGVLVEQSPVFFIQAKKLAELAAEAKLPAIYPSSNYTQAGGFASLGGDLVDNLQHTAGYIGKILNGANPADLAVEGSEKTVLVVNSKAARDLGIAIPAQVQARADNIIE
jgi:putative tryptophan/tyrosine transport system substrate-binding protein